MTDVCVAVVLGKDYGRDVLLVCWTFRAKSQKSMLCVYVDNGSRRCFVGFFLYM